MSPVDAPVPTFVPWYAEWRGGRPLLPVGGLLHVRFSTFCTEPHSFGLSAEHPIRSPGHLVLVEPAVVLVVA